MPRSFGTVSSDSSGPAIHDRKIEQQQTFFRNQIVLEIRESREALGWVAHQMLGMVRIGPKRHSIKFVSKDH